MGQPGTKSKGVPTDTDKLIKIGQFLRILFGRFMEIHHFNPSPFLELQQTIQHQLRTQALEPSTEIPQTSQGFWHFLGIFPVNSRSMLGQ